MKNVLDTATRTMEKGKGKETKGTERNNRGMVVIPYVKHISKGVARVMRKHGVDVAKRSYRILSKALVHPKNNVGKREEM